MSIKKIMAGAVASVMALSTMAVAASAANYDTIVMYADANWGFSTMDANTFVPPTTVVDKDGTYTVSSGTPMWTDEETGDDVPAVSGAAGVFCVDIEGLATLKNAGKDAEGYDTCVTAADKMAFAKAAGINVSDVKVSIVKEDGSTADVAVDQGNILFGDIEGNGKIRIEIYNQYGDTKDAPAVNVDDLNGATEINVTFTISGIDAAAEDNASDDNAAADDTAAADDNAAAGDTAAPTTGDKGAADTGVEGVAVVAGLAIIAAGAVVVAKKRG